MPLLLASLAMGGPADIEAFQQALKTAVDSDDDAFLRAFFHEDLREASDEQVQGYLTTSKSLMTTWMSEGVTAECRPSLCQLQVGKRKRPAMYIKPAPAGHATAYVAHSHGKHMRSFSEHYTLFLRAEGAVRVTINGTQPFIVGAVADGKVDTAYRNDWMVFGDNTLTVEPIGDQAQVDLRVGGHATFTPSPYTDRHNRVHFNGTLSQARSWTVTAAAFVPDDTPWPTDAAAHLQKGLDRWLAGSEEYAFVPWPAWVEPSVHERLVQSEVQRLEPLIMEIDLTVADEWHVRGWFVPHATEPAWAFAELTKEPGRGEYAVGDGPRQVWSQQVSLLVSSLRAKGCPALQRQVDSDYIIERMASPSIVGATRDRGADTSKALKAACQAFSKLPDDAPITYSTDDLLVLGLNDKGRTVLLVDMEVSFRTAWPFLISALKPPRLPR